MRTETTATDGERQRRLMAAAESMMRKHRSTLIAMTAGKPG